MRNAVLTLLCVASFSMGEAAAAGEAEGDALTVMLRTAAPAYHKKDLVVVVAFRNGGDTPVPLGEELFSMENLDVRDREGRAPARAKDAEAPPPESVVLGARETHEWSVNLSTWYPRLTRKKETITVRWSAGSLAAEPLDVAIIRQHDPRKDRRAIIQTEEGPMTWRLLPEHAPQHVKNFVDLARQGHYDGLTIFKVMPGLKIEGGDPRGDGTGAWDDLMMPEFSEEVPPIAGMVGASRRETSMTSNTMFFILLAPTPLMHGKQTFFAVLEDDWRTVSHILARPRKGDSTSSDAFHLHEPVRILSVTIK